MQSEIESLRKRAEALESLIQEFPDLHEVKGRWTTWLVSKSVNAAPEKMTTRHSCGCCSDAAYLAMFYVERNGHKVFSDPPEVCIGSKNPIYGEEWNSEPHDILSEDWQGLIRTTIGEAAATMAAAELATPEDLSS